VHLVYDDPAYDAPAVPAAILAGAEAELSTASLAGHAIGPDPTESAAPNAPPTLLERLFSAWRAWAPRTRRRPPRLAWGAVAMAVVVWLVFFTPGTPVSAAERLWRAIAALVAPEPTPPAPMPRVGPARQRDITLPAPSTPRARAGSPAPAALTPSLLAELEIDVLTALHVRQALAGQRIQVTRTPTGVAVEGLVEGQDRDALVRALREVPHGAALRVTLSTPADLIGTRTTGPPSPATVRAVTLERNAVPAADDLRRALVSRGPAAAGNNATATASAGNVEDEIHRLANDGLRNARRAFLEAATLRTLAERFDAARASELPDNASRKWRALLTAQADRVARAVDQVRTQLEPLFVPNGESAARAAGSGPAPSAAQTRMAAEQRLGDAARRIAEDLGQVERATRAALAVAETAPATIELRDVTFWRRLAATRDRIAAFTHHVIAQ
jgi:hypothetical protein